MKRTARFIYLICLSAFFIAANALNALTIPASEDSYTAPGNKLSIATNNANSLVVDATRKSYLYFDLSEVPTDAVVRWAKLRLFLPIVQRTGSGLSVHLVTSEWNESKTSASLPTLASGSIGVITPDKMASRRFVTVDVTSTVQKWIKGGTINGGTMNEGFAIQPIVKAGSPIASLMLTSKEGPVLGLPAELDIEFQPDSTGSLTNQQVAFLGSYFSPTITAQPSAGDLTVSASGVGLLTYQWLRDGVSIAGATSATLATQGLQSGTYTVVVSNGFSSVTSTSVLFVAPITPTAPTGFALVTGGTLLASSRLGALPVDTFYIGKTEVTLGEWKAVRTWSVANGYTDLDGVGQAVGDNYPVTNVNWYDVVKWCNARSEKEGKTPVYMSDGAVYKIGQVTPTEVASANGYRLPSEKEWEFAAGGGKQTQGYTYSGSNDLNEVGWYNSNSGNAVHEVGKKQANELGIFDMSGNLWEWSGSWYPGYEGSSRVIRGGGWDGGAGGCAVANRSYAGNPGGNRYNDLGFRVALNPSPIGTFALVTSGTLPESSELGALPVDTFYIGKTEVTWGEWQVVRTWAVSNGYTDLANVGAGVGDNYPVSDVNWYDVVKWCNARSEKEEKTPVYKNGTDVYRTGNVSEPALVASANGYRLPSEKEWEFAARGGTQTQGYTFSGSNDLNAVGWYIQNSGTTVHEVGKKQANELGIFDMSGNLWEWSGSWYPGYEGSIRVFRGGYWYGIAEGCSVAGRGGIHPENRYVVLNGFRVALSLVP
jgi:sulfatase modifying factor 1